MHTNEIEQVLTKNFAYPINGRELFEALKSLGECEAMFNGSDTCFVGKCFVGQFPFEEKDQGVIDYSNGNVYFRGSQKLWINSESIFKNNDVNFDKLNIHIIRLIVAQNDNSIRNNNFYDELIKRQDKIALNLIIQNKNTPLTLLKGLILENNNDLFTLLIDALINRAIENSEELALIKNVDGLKRKILGKLVGQ